MEKKNNSNIIIIIIIVIALIVLVFLKNNTKKIQPEELNQTDTALNEAVKSDTTKSINDNINNIKVDDTTDSDLNAVDKELNNL